MPELTVDGMTVEVEVVEEFEYSGDSIAQVEAVAEGLTLSDESGNAPFVRTDRLK